MANGANEENEPPRGIFISYRRDDMGMVVAMLATELGRYLPGIPVFRDRESIRPGHDWAQTIGTEIEKAAVVLVMIGPKWLTIEDQPGHRRLDALGDYVVREIKEALGSDVRRVIPVLLDGASPLTADDLPPAIRELASRQARSLKDDEDFRGRVASFARQLRQEHRDAVHAWRTRERLPAVTPVVNDQTSITAFVAEVKRIREGDSGREADPANAMAALRDFAQLRSIDDLIRLWPAGQGPGGFAELDTVAILTLAAVDRLPEEAAKLAVALRGTEGETPRLTKSIIHDLAAQRTIPDVAEFIKECERLQDTDLMLETVAAFVGSESRVDLDKALLYFELERVGRKDMAKELLAQTLTIEGRSSPEADQLRQQRRLAGAIGEVGIVGALRHLSPTREIVEKYIDDNMDEESDNWGDMPELVARLLRNEIGGDELLARHVTRRWLAAPLVRLCAILAEAEGGDSPRLRLVWRYLAKREHEVMSPRVFLADVIRGYYTSQSAKLKATFPALLREIVTGGEGSAQPCPVDDLDRVARSLTNLDAPAQCRAMLMLTAAKHPERRPGADVAQLLIWVADELRRARQRAGQRPEGPFRRAAQRVNEWFGFDKDLWPVAEAVNKGYAKQLAKDPFQPDDYIGYLTALRDQPILTSWAVRELTAPVAPDQREPGEPTDPAAPRRSKLTGERISEIALQIYHAKRQGTAFDLLERYLENEQAVTWQAVMDIVGQVEEAEREGQVGMRGDPDWGILFGATIGRWTDTIHLQEVYDKLYLDDEERQEKHRGRDYTKEAAAIMSLSQ